MTAPWEDKNTAANGASVKDNFKAWFADSKVVDQQGLPLRVFHGTNHDIQAFDFNRLGMSVDNPTTHFGVYFSKDSDDASSWADRAITKRRANPSQNVVAVYLSIQNPVRLPAETFQYYLKTARESTIIKHKSKWIEAGHDGIITVREGKAWYVAFRPEQIKSAVSNSGLYLASSACTLDHQASLDLMASNKAAKAVEAATNKNRHRRARA